jgi:nicotinate-nucleotide adenylyltransferase
VILGADSYSNIRKWKNYELIVNNYRVYVYNRIGFNIEKNEFNATILDAPLLDISSTLIRAHLKNKKSVKYLVQEKVFQELMNNKYYR